MQEKPEKLKTGQNGKIAEIESKYELQVFKNASKHTTTCLYKYGKRH